jgi:CBS domain-containing protein
MKARDLMVHPVATVRIGDSLAHAVALMRAHDCGAVVVVDDGTAAAMLTDRDVCLTALRTNRPLSDMRVEHAMSNRVHTCNPDDDVAHVAEQMALHRVRRVPVVDEECRPIGMVSLDDIARLARDQRDMFAPAVSEAAVGAALGAIRRPGALGAASETLAAPAPDAR